MNYSNLENFLNRVFALAIIYTGLLLASMTLLPDAFVPVQLPSFMAEYVNTTSGEAMRESALSLFNMLLFIIALGSAVVVFALPNKIVSEINFWLLIAVYLLLPFLYSRDTKENFLLVKETTLRIFLISMFAVFLFRKLSNGTLMQHITEIPWHLMAFVGIGVFSFLWTATPYSTFHYSLIFISYMMLYIITTDTIKKPWQVYSISDILITAAAIASMYGILQYYRVAGTNHNYDPLFGVGEVIGNSDRKRVFSFFGNPVFLGVYLDAALPIAFAMFFSAFACGSRWAHKYEKYILRSQIILLSFAITFCFVFMGLASSAVSSYTAANPNALSDQKVSVLITNAGSNSFIFAPVVFAILFFGALMIYWQSAYWQKHERQIYRLANGLISFLAIFMCIFITFTRTAWIATAAALFFFAVYILVYAHDLIYAYRKWIIAFVLLCTFATIAFTAIYFKPGALNTGTESIANRFTSAFTVVQRLMLYDITFNVIKQAPILGHGLGSFGYFYPIHQEKFYNGEFRMLIDWINSFCQTLIPNKTINFMVWSFEKTTTSRLYQFMASFYFMVLVIGGMFLLIYYKDLRKSNIVLFNQSMAAYLAAVVLPPLLAFLKFSRSGQSYLGPTENVLFTDPEKYHWLSAGFAHVHNEYLQVWSDLGILGLLIFLYVFYDYFVKGSGLLTKLKNSPDRIIIIGYLCAVIASLVESLANFPFQRIMPILITVLGFTMMFRGDRIFENAINGSAEEEEEPEPEPSKSGQRSYKDAFSIDSAILSVFDTPPLFDDTAKFNSLDQNTKASLMDNLSFYAVVSIAVLSLNYFPVRYVLGNIDLKSGHTLISQAQTIKSENRDYFDKIIKEGMRYLERSCERVPYNSESWFWFGDTLKLLGNYDGAIKKFDMALKICNTKHVFYSMGVCYFEKFKKSGNRDEMEKALYYWKRSVGVNPNFSQPLFHLGFFEFQNGNYAESFKYFKRAIKWDSDGSFADAYKFAGLSAYHLRQITDAIELLSEAKKKGSGGVSKYLGSVLNQTGNLQEAARAFEDAFEENPTDGELYSHLIQLYKRLGTPDKALVIFNAKNDSIKGTPDYYLESGKLYSMLGNQDRALAELGKGLEKDAGNLKIFEEIGRIYFDEKKDYNTAMTFWEKIVKIEPSNLKSQYNLGACYYRMGNLLKAKEIWTSIKEKNKNQDKELLKLDENLKALEEKLAKNKPESVKPENAPNQPQNTDRKTFFNN